MGTPDENGIYPDYCLPAELRPKPPQEAGVKWSDIIEHWELVVCDLAAIYGVKEWECDPMPWPRLRSLVVGLLSREESLTRVALTESNI